MTIDTSTSSVSTVSDSRTVDELLNRGVEEIIVRTSLEKKLKGGKKLRIKYGVDPTKPDIHLGHMVAMRKLKQLQEDGHKIIFLIGDYTTKIGDPSGRKTARPILSDEEIKHNAETYFRQVGNILEVEKTEIRFNSEWFGKMKSDEFLLLTSNFTVNRIIEREDFSNRIKEKRDIGLHELFYPLMQAYDSVVLKADVAFCGVDQKLNELAGRTLQKRMGQPPQDIVMVKLLIGLDGKIKMSKSANNYIAINDSPKDIFGKVMSIPDNLIMHYYELCTDVTMEALKIIERELSPPAGGGKNPRDVKADLAKLIVEMFYTSAEAEKAAVEFDKVFKRGEKPEEIPTRKIEVSKCRIDDLLMKCNLVSSKSEARRLIKQGGVEIEGQKITDFDRAIEVKDEMIIQVGKRKFLRIKR